MTVGIGLITKETVILVADGRTTYLTGDADSEDDADKRLSFCKNMALVFGGVSTIRNVAIRNLGMMPPTLATLEKRLAMTAQFALHIALASLPADARKERPNLSAGLIAGGFLDGRCVLATAVAVPDRPPRTQLVFNAGAFAIMGGGEGSFDRLGTALVASRSRSGRPEEQSLAASVDTIRAIAKTNPKVGGTIRYCVLRSDQEREFGSVEPGTSGIVRLKEPAPPAKLASVEEIRAQLRRHWALNTARERRRAEGNRKAAEGFCSRHGIPIRSVKRLLARKYPAAWKGMVMEFELYRAAIQEYEDLPTPNWIPECGRADIEETN